MASEEKQHPQETAPEGPAKAPPGPGRKPLLLGGGIVSLVAAAWALSLVAVPDKPAEHEKRVIQGPFVADVSPSSGFQVNLAGDGGRHYLALNLKVEVDAFEESYATAHASEPLYQAKLADAVLRTASQKTKSEVDNPVGREVFREELREALDPVLFPIHVGDELRAEGRHPESGLRAGRSIDRSSLRGLFHEHALHLDARNRSVRLDDGTPVVFQGDESDLFVADARGKGVYVDVSAIEPDYQGQVPVGALGRVRNVYFGSFLTQ